jgi:hypothetical protein
MPIIQGDRRGSNPRQLEPQSRGQFEISTSCEHAPALAGRVRIGDYEAGRTRCENDFGDAWRGVVGP